MSVNVKLLHELEAEFGRLQRIVAVVGAAMEADQPTDFAKEAATWLLSEAAEDIGSLHERVHVALGGEA